MRERGYVIGDLHLGAGPDDPLEDFRDDDAFAAMCERIADSDATLFLNGDIIDFAQIPPFDVPKAAHLLWTEAASLEKVQTALAAHPLFFDGLRSFLEGGGRVRFQAGNHDLDMVWPRVQRTIVERLGGPATDQLSFGIGAVEFHGVHIEHGHHFTPENCPRDPLAFCHRGPGDVAYLERVWGTDFMLQFYNELESQYPFADNVKPMLKVAWHGLRKGWIGGREVLRMLVFLKKRGLPWRAMLSATLPAVEPVSPAAAAGSFGDLAWQEAVLDRAQADEQFVTDLYQAFAELEPQEQRIAALPEQIDIVEPEPVSQGATLGLFREERELRAARDRLSGDGITHVIFGHTHTLVDGELEGRLYNPGTWLPCLDLRAEHVKARLAVEGVSLDVLQDSRLYSVERRLVRIDAEPTCEASVRIVSAEDP